MRTAVFVTLSLSLAAASSESGATYSAKNRSADSRAVHAIPPTGVLSEADLIAIARLEARTKVDQFTDDPTLEYVGRKFVITLGRKQLTTEYDQNAHALTVLPSTFVDFFELGRDVSSSSYLGQNAFGVKTKVSQQRGNAFGVCNPWRFSGISALKGSDWSGGVRYMGQLNGPAARQLSNSIRLRLWGIITRLDRGPPWRPTAVFMEPKLDVATIDHPYDTIVHQYVVSATFDKAEWIDGRSGEVIGASDITERGDHCSIL